MHPPDLVAGQSGEVRGKQVSTMSWWNLSWMGGDAVLAWVVGEHGECTDSRGEEKSFWDSIKFKSLRSGKAGMSGERVHMGGCAAGEEAGVQGEGLGITRQWGQVPARHGFVRGSDSQPFACVRIT